MLTGGNLLGLPRRLLQAVMAMLLYVDPKAALPKYGQNFLLH